MKNVLIEELIREDNIVVKNSSHRRCIELFYPFMNSFTDNQLTIKKFFQRYIERSLTTNFRETACFNGRYDYGKQKEPFNVHLYMQFDEVRLHLYYVAKKSDLEDALIYKETDEFEYKVLVINQEMRRNLSSVTGNRLIVINECDIERLVKCGELYHK